MASGIAIGAVQFTKYNELKWRTLPEHFFNFNELPEPVKEVVKAFEAVGISAWEITLADNDSGQVRSVLIDEQFEIPFDSLMKANESLSELGMKIKTIGKHRESNDWIEIEFESLV